MKPKPDLWRDQEGFNVVSLGDWIDLCGKADVPCVPAEKVAFDISIERLLKCDPDDPILTQFEIQMREAAQESNIMLRWDCCAPLEVKLRLAKGQCEWSPEPVGRFPTEQTVAYRKRSARLRNYL